MVLLVALSEINIFYWFIKALIICNLRYVQMDTNVNIKIEASSINHV